MMRTAPASAGGVITALFTVIVGLLLFLLADLVKERVAASPRLRVEPRLVEIRADASADPLGRSLAQLKLSGSRVLRPGHSILDPRLPAIVTANLERNPWVRCVKEVDRRFPNGLRIDVEMRRPLAVYHVSTERLAVDADGVVIESFTQLAPPRLPWIKVPGRVPALVPRTGGAFASNSAVREAVDVLAEFARVGDHPAVESLRIDEVLVGVKGRDREPGDPDVRLVLDSGVQIHWGRSPRSTLAVMENDARTKLDLLARVLRTYPGLLNVAAVDLRFGRPEVTPRRPARSSGG